MIDRKRIAVVGAGVSGLTAAHLLHPRHDVTLFEAGSYAGGHTNTIRVDTEHATHHVDTGFIVLNDRNYPRFERLLADLDVPTQPSDMSFSVRAESHDFEYAGNSLNALFARRRHAADPRFHRMVRDLVRFNREARTLLAGSNDGPSVGEYLDAGGYSSWFIHRLLVPQASAVWSADPQQMWAFPLRFLVEFFANHGMLGLRDRPRWRTVQGGSARYVEALTRPFADRIRLDAPVRAIRRDDAGVQVTSAGAETEHFDEVVLATHSDQALALLADASAAEREILGAIGYQPNEAVLHTDASLLPRRRRAWASWNFHLLDEPAGNTTVTYHMNRLQALDADREFCVTLNRTASIDPEKVVRVIDYEHPVFTRAGVAAQARHGEINGALRTYFCGAYWGWGFHEDGVASAYRACAPLLRAGTLEAVA